MAGYIRMFIIIGAILFCTGCNKKDNKNTVEDDISDNISKEATLQEETSYENAGNYFQAANIIQDCNPNQAAYINNNIIQMVQNDLMYSLVKDYDKNSIYICVADLKTGVQVPLCSKVDCNHNNDKCNAYLGNNTIFGNMWCVDGIIYLFGNRTQEVNGNKTQDYFLMRISSDGSIREDLGSVLTVYGDSSEGTINMGEGNVLVHRGYLYYVLTEMENEKMIDNVVKYGKTTEKLYRYNINGKSEPECIYEYTIEEDGTISVIMAAHEENIYVTLNCAFWDYSGEISRLGEFKCEEYKININTLEKEEITSGVNYCETVQRDSKSYINKYNSAGNIVTIELDTMLEYEEQLKAMKVSFYDKETEEIRYLMENYIEEAEHFAPNDFWITDKYICLNTMTVNGEDVGTTYVFDFDWNLIKKFDKTIDHCFGEYILWHESSGDEKDYYIGKLEDYINNNRKCGRICKIIDRAKGSIADMNRYIYEDQ